MPYATPEEVLERWPEAPVEDAQDKRLALALEDAGALMDSYLSQRYEVPITENVPRLMGLCVDIGCYFVARSDAQMSEDLRLRYADAKKFLEQVAAGTLTIPELGPEGNTDTGESGSAVVLFEGPEKVMGRDKGY